MIRNLLMILFGMILGGMVGVTTMCLMVTASRRTNKSVQAIQSPSKWHRCYIHPSYNCADGNMCRGNPKLCENATLNNLYGQEEFEL